MARTTGSDNKSQAIRDFKSANPKSKPRDIASALVEKGHDVTAQYVSVVLSNARKSKKGKRGRPAASASAPAAATGRGRGRPRLSAAAAPKASGSGLGLAELRLAKQLVASAGGQKQAREAIDTIVALLN